MKSWAPPHRCNLAECPEVAPHPVHFAPEIFVDDERSSSQIAALPTTHEVALSRVKFEPTSAPTQFAANVLQEKWRELVTTVREALPRHGKSLSYARVLSIEPPEIRISFPPDAGFHKTTVMGSQKASIEKELSSKLGRAVTLVEVANAAAETGAPLSLAQEETNERNTRRSDIEIKMKSHPALTNVLRILGGAVEHIRVIEKEILKPAPETTEDA